MSVKIINGNLLDATEDIICHQVNCQGVMGSGVAKAIREKWPWVFASYHRCCERNNNDSTRLFGTIWGVKIDGDSRWLVNMFAQNLYGYDGNRYTSYDAFYKCLERIRDGDGLQNCSIAFPYKIGSDRGGASWDVIYAMICDVLGDRDVTIYRLEE